MASRMNIVQVMLLASCCVLGSGLACGRIEGDVPRHLTLGWHGMLADEDPGDPEGRFRVLMRYSDATHGDLLLTREGSRLRPNGETEEFSIYSYKPETQEFREVDRRSWHAASGDIVECRGQAGAGVFIRPIDRKLLVNNREVPTHAPLAVLATTSSDRGFAAVLSAEGPLPGLSFSPLDGAGFGAGGQHYEQVLDVETGEFIGKAVRVPLISKDGVYACWAPQNEVVIYWYSGWIVFVPVVPLELKR